MTALAGDPAIARRRVRRPDQVLVSSGWMFATQVMMSASGLAFWLVAARLHTPADVGFAGTLITAMLVLSLFAQVGLEATLVQVLPSSSRPKADVIVVTSVVATVGVVLGLGYALVLPLISPDLAVVLEGRSGVPVFAVLVAGFAVNGLSDAALLAASRLRANLVINGVLLSALKVSLPLVLVSSGSRGLVLASGLATLGAAVASIVVVLRALDGPGGFRPSPELLAARSFARAGYAVSVLDLVPPLVFPVLIIHAHGGAAGGTYYLGLQVALLLLAVGFTLNNAMYAEASKRPQEAHVIVRRTGVLLAGALVSGALVLALSAPLVMRVFGAEYASDGVPLLRLLAGAMVLAGLASWSALRLRVQGRLRTMMTTYALGTALVLGLAWWWVGASPLGIPLAWGAGRGATLLVNLVLGARR